MNIDCTAPSRYSDSMAGNIHGKEYSSKTLDYPLRPNERVFVALYLRSFNRIESAVGAGYKRSNASNTAWKLLNTRPQVIDAINKGVDEIVEELKIDRATIGNMQIEAYEKAKELNQPAVMVAAAGKLAQLYGLNKPQTLEIEHTEKTVVFLPSNGREAETLENQG